MKYSGAVACGHPVTASAAESVLREGGNAFDAVIAAYYAACVAEPVLASLGGGGFLLARTRERRDRIYDFFAHTPQRPLPADELDFYPIHADFGATKQEFHIGLGSIATPGAIKGIFGIHRDLGSMPMKELALPAIEAARDGIRVNALQAYIQGIVSPILTATPEARSLFRSKTSPDDLIREGELLQQSQFANFLEALADEGDDLFYRGEIAQSIAGLCARGGQLTRRDLEEYRVIVREPVSMNYRRHRVLTNPAPSCGGTLIAFALNLLEHAQIHRHDFGSRQHLRLLAETMQLTNEARFETLSSDAGLERLLDEILLDSYREKIAGNRRALRGTTHISVIDGDGNVACLTTSNGEGCGHLVPDTGLMLNNMLGEEDLNPDGFHRWPANRRMTSMMAPTLLLSPDGTMTCLGSGGSNRLRTAILQVLVNIVDYRKPLHDAINAPRLHVEKDLLSVEPGFDARQLQPLLDAFPQHRLWRQNNLFFGGVHAVSERGGSFDGAGDGRRGGVAVLIR